MTIDFARNTSNMPDCVWNCECAMQECKDSGYTEIELIRRARRQIEIVREFVREEITTYWHSLEQATTRLQTPQLLNESQLSKYAAKRHEAEDSLSILRKNMDIFSKHAKTFADYETRIIGGLNPCQMINGNPMADRRNAPSMSARKSTKMNA